MWGMPANPNPKASGFNSKRIVQTQCFDRRTTANSAPNDFGTVGAPQKMSLPELAAGIEQSYSSSTQRIAAVGASAFVLVAGSTTEPEVLNLITTTCRNRNNVVDFERTIGQRLLCLAITVAILGFDTQLGSLFGGDTAGCHGWPAGRSPRLTASTRASAFCNCPNS